MEGPGRNATGPTIRTISHGAENSRKEITEGQKISKSKLKISNEI